MKSRTVRDEESPFLLVVRSGPNFDLEGHIAQFAQALSGRFDGEIWTYGSDEGELDVGDFRIRRVAFPIRPTPIRRLLYLARIWRRAFRARFVLRRKVVIITYDPFQSGIIGLAIKWTLGARFVCEVNGVYAHPDTLIDIADETARAKKRSRMVRVGTFILRRADAIKLLFREQLEGFDVPAEHPPRHVFFDMINRDAFPFVDREPEPLLIFVGHPFLLKGVDLLLESFAELSPSFPEWRLVLIGWRIDEPAVDYDYPRDKVDFVGPQDPALLTEWMTRCSALVLPSRSEGMGRVLIEAAFKGRARIGSRAGGIPTVIDDGVDGLLFETGDRKSLTDTLRVFMGDPDLRARLGDAARVRAEATFTAEKYLEHYTELIEQLPR